MIIKRTILALIQSQLGLRPKVVLLYGPRQSGKTTLVKEIANQFVGNSVYFFGEDLRVQEVWSKPDAKRLSEQIGRAELVIIDEAQKIDNIETSLKLLFDTKNVSIIASGSSSFDLAQKINEPLTGRTVTFTLYPLSILEVPVVSPSVSVTDRLEEFLRFGLYPEVVTTEGEKEKEDYLNELVSNYLYKDILSFESVRKPKKVVDLLTLLALQIGNEVSIQELAANLSLSKIIVEKYLDLLEKMFVVVNLRGFSRNLRKEISKTSKYFFVDLGLRNALIRNFNPLALRGDTGAMFENFCVMEKVKSLANRKAAANFYFWRTYDQKEIDLIEEKKGKIFAFEFKWQRGKTHGSAQREFLETYRNSEFLQVTKENFLAFLEK